MLFQTLTVPVMGYADCVGCQHMDNYIIDRMRREEAELSRKLEAVRAVLSAYGVSAATDRLDVKDEATAEVVKGKRSSERSAAEKLPIERFSLYGQNIVKAALEECLSRMGSPISSRDMVQLLKMRGIEVQGKDPANALSSLLARASVLKPNGRRGWTVADDYMTQVGIPSGYSADDFDVILGDNSPQRENEPHSGNAGGSDAVRESVAPLELTQVHSGWGRAT